MSVNWSYLRIAGPLLGAFCGWGIAFALQGDPDWVLLAVCALALLGWTAALIYGELKHD